MNRRDKIKLNILNILFRLPPSGWITIYERSQEVDVFLLDCMEKGEYFRPGLCTHTVRGEVIWTEGYPYAYGGFYKDRYMNRSKAGAYVCWKLKRYLKNQEKILKGCLMWIEGFITENALFIYLSGMPVIVFACMMLERIFPGFVIDNNEDGSSVLGYFILLIIWPFAAFALLLFGLVFVLVFALWVLSGVVAKPFLKKDTENNELE